MVAMFVVGCGAIAFILLSGGGGLDFASRSRRNRSV